MWLRYATANGQCPRTLPRCRGRAARSVIFRAKDENLVASMRLSIVAGILSCSALMRISMNDTADLMTRSDSDTVPIERWHEAVTDYGMTSLQAVGAVIASLGVVQPTSVGVCVSLRP